MSYSIKVNTGSGLQLMNNASFEGCTLDRSRDEGTPRVRSSVNGSVKFYGNDYSNLKVLRDSGSYYADGQILWDNEVIYTGDLSLVGVWDEAANVCELSFATNDNYTKLLQSQDLEKDFDGNFVSKTTLKVIRNFRTMFEARSTTGDNNTPHENEAWKSLGGAGDPQKWQADKCYKKAKVYPNNQATAYIGNMSDSFVFVEGVGLEGRSFIAACTKDNKGVDPQTDINNDPIIAEAKEYWEPCHAAYKWNVGQRYSEIYWDRAYFDPDDKYWVKAETTPTSDPVYWDIRSIDLFTTLQEFLNEIDPTVTINLNTYLQILQQTRPDIARLVMYGGTFLAPTVNGSQESEDEYTCESVTPQVQNLSFGDLLGAYKALFNVDWMLTDENEFRFLHPSEVAYDPPEAVDILNFVNTAYSQDFSNSLFSEDQAKQILKEEFTLGNNSKIWSFDKQVILYNNPYTDKMEYTFTAFDVDVASTWRELSENIVIIAENSEGEMFITGPAYSNLQYPLYNGALNLYSLITDFWNWDRPYDDGEIVDAPESLSGPTTWHKIRDNNSEIKIPAYDPGLLDFNKYVITSFGNLKAENISVDLQTASAIIKASKQ